ncbi:YqaA family protein [Chloroflexota bacterium]
MDNKVDDRVSAGSSASSLKRRLVFLLALLLIVAVVVALQLYYGRNPERIMELGKHLYWGAFLISLVGNATILFPGAVLVILANLGALIYSVDGLMGPIVIGLVGGFGAAIGEITGYVAGYSGRSVVERKKIYSQVEVWVRKWGAPAIFVFSLVPFVFDLVGIVTGVLRFPFWKFFFLCWAGRIILYVAIVLLTAMGLNVWLPWYS